MYFATMNPTGQTGDITWRTPYETNLAGVRPTWRGVGTYLKTDRNLLLTSRLRCNLTG
jgi:hypothetical protein